MRYTKLGPLDHISRLTLGGGGLGEIWGATTPEAAGATVRAALDAGVNLIDTAPMYRRCETVISRCMRHRPSSKLASPRSRAQLPS